MNERTKHQVFLIDRQHHPRHHDPAWCPACEAPWPCEIHYLVHPECSEAEHHCEFPFS